MKLFADENLEHPIVEALRQRGHDVTAMPAEGVGSPDPEVLTRSHSESRILLTNDKDFAELVFLQGKAATGILLIRLPRFRTPQKVERVLEVVESQGERLLGVFTVVQAQAIRRRPFLSLQKKRPSG